MKSALVAVCAWFVAVGPVCGNPFNDTISKFEYCMFGINETSNGRAYTIESLADAKLDFTQSYFEEHLKTIYMMEKFNRKFSDNYLGVLDNLEWLYNFETVRRVNDGDLLVRETCIYITDWSSDFQIDLNYTGPHEEYLLLKTLFHLKTEGPSDVPMPILDFPESPTGKQIICNFAISPYNMNEYYFEICFADHYNDRAYVGVIIVELNTIDYVSAIQNLQDMSDVKL